MPDTAATFPGVAAFAPGAARKRDAVRRGRDRSFAVRRDKKTAIKFVL